MVITRNPHCRHRQCDYYEREIGRMGPRKVVSKRDGQ